eukprot:7603868-Heterocapsa_arctica.AAC.1
MAKKKARTTERVMADQSPHGHLRHHAAMLLLKWHAEAESAASSSSAENSPIIPWAEFFADKGRSDDAEALAYCSTRPEAPARASSDSFQ